MCHCTITMSKVFAQRPACSNDVCTICPFPVTVLAWSAAPIPALFNNDVQRMEYKHRGV